MAVKRDANALYWQLQRKLKAYIIKGYLATYGNIGDAAKALGVTRAVISREIDVLRTFGLIDHPSKLYSVSKDESPKQTNGSIEDLARAHVAMETESDSLEPLEAPDATLDDESESDHEPEPSA